MGILHRDIKPDNMLFVTKERDLNNIKLSDFGLAKILEDNQMASTTCGTPGYIAPEILKLDKYGKECDFWSIGVLTYVLLSGTLPFYDEDRDLIFKKIQNCDYKFDQKIWDKISSEGRDFVSKLIVLNPNKRLNFDEMIDHPWLAK
jgi:serine/threonine protein kinase